jgi:prephenate dehydrogenase
MAEGSVGIVGLGLMGGSLALALRRAWPETALTGCDRDPLTVRRALDRGIVDVAGPDLDAVRPAGLIVLALPVLAMREALRGLAGSTAVVTDLASTKAEVMRWAGDAGVDLVGGHPMCGRETSGLEAADADLYRGAPWVLTRSEPRVEALVRAVGARPVVIDPERHDRLVAGVSHAAFVVSTAYVLGVTSSPEWPEAGRLAAAGFRDLTRLAAGDPEMETGIVRTNRANLLEALDAFEAALQRIRRHVEQDDPRLAELFEEARRARERWRERQEEDGARPG